jgi:hypothetical protein
MNVDLSNDKSANNITVKNLHLKLRVPSIHTALGNVLSLLSMKLFLKPNTRCECMTDVDDGEG